MQTFTKIFKFLPMVMLAACASPEASRKSAPPVVVVGKCERGQITSAKAVVTVDRIYVTGTAGDVRTPPLHAHIDVELIDASDRVIATAHDDLEIPSERQKRARGHRHAFTASFPREHLEQVAKIHVIFHGEHHPENHG